MSATDPAFIMEMLPFLHTPAQFFGGAPLARAIAAAIPGADLAVIDGAGHLSNLEATAAFTAAVRKSINRG